MPLTSPICRFAPSPPPSLKEAKEFAFQGIVKPSKLSKLTKPIVYPSTYDPTSPPPPPPETKRINPQTQKQTSDLAQKSLLASKSFPPTWSVNAKPAGKYVIKGDGYTFESMKQAKAYLKDGTLPKNIKGKGPSGGKKQVRG